MILTSHVAVQVRAIRLVCPAEDRKAGQTRRSECLLTVDPLGEQHLNSCGRSCILVLLILTCGRCARPSGNMLRDTSQRLGVYTAESAILPRGVSLKIDRTHKSSDHLFQRHTFGFFPGTSPPTTTRYPTDRRMVLLCYSQQCQHSRDYGSFSLPPLLSMSTIR